jgi:hypothetical protein
MDYLLDRGQTLPILSAGEQWLSTKKSEHLNCRHFLQAANCAKLFTLLEN